MHAPFTARPSTIAIASATRHPLSVYDGTIWIGHLIRRGNDFEAIDSNGASCGVFHDMKSAAFAIPVRGASS